MIDKSDRMTATPSSPFSVHQLTATKTHSPVTPQQGEMDRLGWFLISFSLSSQDLASLADFRQQFQVAWQLPSRKLMRTVQGPLFLAAHIREAWNMEMIWFSIDFRWTSPKKSQKNFGSRCERVRETCPTLLSLLTKNEGWWSTIFRRLLLKYVAYQSHSVPFVWWMVDACTWCFSTGLVSSFWPLIPYVLTCFNYHLVGKL